MKNGTFKALAQAIMRMRVPFGILNDCSVVEWRLTKAVEMGYKLAVSEMLETINKKNWK